MKLKYNLIFVLLSLTRLNLSAQVDTAWTRRFSGNAIDDDIVTALTVDHIGNVYVTGSCKDTIASNIVDQIVTIKYSSSGDINWVAKYPIIFGNCRGHAVAVDNYGNVFVTGWIHGISSSSQFATFKYDSLGQEKWIAFYDNGWDDEPRAITLDIQGNVYVTGLSSGGFSDFDYATIKYNSTGEQQWVARYTNSIYGNDIPTSIAVDDLGNVYVTGTSYDSTTYYDILTVKYNSLGQQQWIHRYDDPGLAGSRDDCAYAIAVDKIGNIVVTGGIQGVGNLGLPPEGYRDCITIKYNSLGDTIWVRKYDSGRGMDWGSDLLIDSLNNIYITGTGYGLSSPDYLTLKYNSNGQLIWDKYYNGLNYASEDEAKSIAIDKVGNVYITGKSGVTGLYWNFATLKYNPNGEEQWSIRYGDNNYPTYHQAIAIAVDGQNNVLVTGQSRGNRVNDNYRDFLTIKYIQDSTSSLLDEKTKPTEYLLFQNFPNPFNPATVISYQLPVRGSVMLKVYDLLGREVATLVDEYKSAGNYEVEFNPASGIRHLESGVYFCRLQTKNYTKTIKMLYLK